MSVASDVGTNARSPPPGKANRSKQPQSADPQVIGDLPYAALKKLADKLDTPCGNEMNWRKLILAIPTLPYDQTTVEKFGMNANRVDGSPGYALLTDMSNRGISYKQLVTGFKKINLAGALYEVGYREEVAFVRHPVAVPVCEGQRLELECVVTGVPVPTLLWFRNREPLPDQTSTKLVIESVRPSDSGQYCCRAGNELNYEFSNWAQVRVELPAIMKHTPMPPHDVKASVLITQDLPPTAKFHAGETLNLRVFASGAGSLTYEWLQNGEKLPYAQASSDELRVVGLTQDNQGGYCVRISNAVNSVLSKTCQVVVLPLENVTHFSEAHTPVQPAMQQHTGLQHHAYAPSTVPPTPDLFPPPPVPSYLMEPPPQFPYKQQTQQVQQQLSPHDPAPPPPGPHLGGLPTEVFRGDQGGGAYFRLPVHHSPVVGGALPPPPAEDEAGGQSTIHTPFAKPDPNTSVDLNDACYDKVALLIGNKVYHQSTLALNTPENDTQDLAGLLRSADFKVVSLVNLTKKDMEQAVQYFETLIGKNVYALFFFAGHGFELGHLNYMMAVDATMDKNPEHCLCAQDVLKRMQARGAKLSTVLLDACRVASSHAGLPAVNYEVPPLYDYRPHSNATGYFVYGFSCSEDQRAYEAGSSNTLPEGEKENSIFVSALKRGSHDEPIDRLLSNAAEGVRKRGNSVNRSSKEWQMPEIRHNMGERLTLFDPIARCSSQGDTAREERAKLWQSAHCVPNPAVVWDQTGELVLRLHFEAEHSNVLVLSVELLNGCITHTKVRSMEAFLTQDSNPGFPMIKSVNYKQFGHSRYQDAHQRAQLAEDLMHFKIHDLQKIQSPAVTLHLQVQYCTRVYSEWGEQRTCEVTHPLDPPLYAKVLNQSLPRLQPQGYLY